jgi:hypothetical protein
MYEVLVSFLLGRGVIQDQKNSTVMRLAFQNSVPIIRKNCLTNEGNLMTSLRLFVVSCLTTFIKHIYFVYKFLIHRIILNEKLEIGLNAASISQSED